MNTSGRKIVNLINRISRTVGTNSIKIQVLGTQKKRLKLDLLSAMGSEVLNLCLNYN